MNGTWQNWMYCMEVPSSCLTDFPLVSILCYPSSMMLTVFNPLRKGIRRMGSGDCAVIFWFINVFERMINSPCCRRTQSSPLLWHCVGCSHYLWNRFSPPPPNPTSFECRHTQHCTSLLVYTWRKLWKKQVFYVVNSNCAYPIMTDWICQTSLGSNAETDLWHFYENRDVFVCECQC
jgi:hypothetical protein